MLGGLSIKVTHHKCFKSDAAGFDQIKQVNIVIGRNNSGKSTLLEILEYATKGSLSAERIAANNSETEFHFTKELQKQEIARTFLSGTSDAVVGDYREFGQRWIGKTIRWSQKPGHPRQFVSVDPAFPNSIVKANLPTTLVKQLDTGLEGKALKWIAPERYVRPEHYNKGVTLDINPDGSGLTRLIATVINETRFDSALVEQTLLEEINKVLSPDAHINDIVVQLDNVRDSWEIYIHEKNKGRIQLSHSGSGIRTVFLVLALIHVLPTVENRKLSDYVFVFEELENNLHPSLERRLLLYLADIAAQNRIPFFFSTHSNVCIDLFGTSRDAQILHVVHDGYQAVARTVHTYFDNKGVLDDLDVRASDLLQSNAVVWVEGPSDRIYFNHWIKLLTNGALREGAHYQCVSYGGRLLSHLTATIDSDVKELQSLVEILRLNRNAVMLIDSDKRSKRDSINKTKIRIQSEIENGGGVVWISSGREIENHLPVAAVQKLDGLSNFSIASPYDDFGLALDRAKKGQGRRFEKNKVLFAEQVVPHITVDNMKDVKGLLEKLQQVISYIRKCNRAGEAAP